jgi:hypothetical protein
MCRKCARNCVSHQADRHGRHSGEVLAPPAADDRHTARDTQSLHTKHPLWSGVDWTASVHRASVPPNPSVVMPWVCSRAISKRRLPCSSGTLRSRRYAQRGESLTSGLVAKQERARHAGLARSAGSRCDGVHAPRRDRTDARPEAEGRSGARRQLHGQGLSTSHISPRSLQCHRGRDPGDRRHLRLHRNGPRGPAGTLHVHPHLREAVPSRRAAARYASGTRACSNATSASRAFGTATATRSCAMTAIGEKLAYLSQS